ncbi:hypothetical protein HAX54_029652 [Datura stramonium]|uniref:RING-type domain-containing protein n=1 Tax=Datura stramonium TaxID=4076 RepID=A0ABS8SAC9_DATST|nr:hypothetical protein [Datura stramonium]
MADWLWPFYQLLQEKCPICKEEFIMDIYPEVDNENAVYFLKGCCRHPIHLSCILSFWRFSDEDFDTTYQEVMEGRRNVSSLRDHPFIKLKCPVCRAPLGDLLGVILTPMWNPMPGMASAEPSATSAACCHFPLQHEEYFLELSCGHKMHSRCYLNALIGDYSWHTYDPPIPNKVYCPECVIEVKNPSTTNMVKMIVSSLVVSNPLTVEAEDQVAMKKKKSSCV